MDYLVEREVRAVHVMMMVALELPIRKDHQPALKRVCVDMECPEGAKVMHGEHVCHFCYFKFFKTTRRQNHIVLFDQIEVIYLFGFSSYMRKAF